MLVLCSSRRIVSCRTKSRSYRNILRNLLQSVALTAFLEGCKMDLNKLLKDLPLCLGSRGFCTGCATLSSALLLLTLRRFTLLHTIKFTESLCGLISAYWNIVSLPADGSSSYTSICICTENKFSTVESTGGRCYGCALFSSVSTAESMLLICTVEKFGVHIFFRVLKAFRELSAQDGWPFFNCLVSRHDSRANRYVWKRLGC